jgi:uncharacterized protein YbjT (DUF2867 family)
MKLIITGGSGFLGGFVLREAVRRGYEVAALARSPAAARRVRELGARGFGHASGIVAAAQRAQVRRAVFVSTTAVTTTRPAAIRQVRLAAEQRIAGSGLDWTILRPTMIYGAPGDRNLCRLLPLLRRAPVLPVPGGAHLQQPVHAADVAHAVLAAARGYEQVRRLAEDKAFTIRPAARDLGFAPRSFAAGIRAEARALGLAA